MMTLTGLMKYDVVGDAIMPRHDGEVLAILWACGESPPNPPRPTGDPMTAHDLCDLAREG
jgi:hypothetical protein